MPASPFAAIVWATLLSLAPPPEAEVQGLYEGAKGATKLEARVVALGKEAYKVYVRLEISDGKIAKAELDGKTDGEAVSFKGKAGEVEWTATWKGGAIKGSAGQDPLEAKRVQRK